MAKMRAKKDPIAMYVTIYLTESEVAHLYPDHVFYDSCSEVECIMQRIQEQIAKKKKNEATRK